jgi:hypothetical protein
VAEALPIRDRVPSAAVALVNFAFIDGDIILRTSAEGKLAAATRRAVETSASIGTRWWPFGSGARL